eukprot:GHUV01006393.1.p1 GENE.GHUV01006393.1~~GHUV01006393.1.p1  ORF type:complete len:180 (+),score=40.05 GHUV01006393.1:209-748(+)
MRSSLVGRRSFRLVLIVAIAVLMNASQGTAEPEKIGAGLLLCCNGQVLLLKRHSKHNDQTWALPGGNVEASDDSLLSTATREAFEELGSVPPFEVRAQILTKRGENDQKHYTVFVADVQPSVQLQFKPELNAEHSEWRWVPWSDVVRKKLDLHPVVKKLVKNNAVQISNILQSCLAKTG